jgi:hypothetical protein
MPKRFLDFFFEDYVSSTLVRIALPCTMWGHLGVSPTRIHFSYSLSSSCCDDVQPSVLTVGDQWFKLLFPSGNLISFRDMVFLKCRLSLKKIYYHVLILSIWRCFTIGFRYFFLCVLHPCSTNELCALFQESFRVLHPWRAKDVACVVPVSLSLLRAWSS